MDHNEQEQVALHRWVVIVEAAGDKLTARERGALVRQIAVRAHPHPDGSSRTYSRRTRRSGDGVVQRSRHAGPARSPVPACGPWAWYIGQVSLAR